MKVMLTSSEDQMDKSKEICYQQAIAMNFKIYKFTIVELIDHWPLEPG